MAWPLRAGPVAGAQADGSAAGRAAPEEAAHIQRTAEEERGQLVGPDSSQLERLLSERVFVNWLATLYCSRTIELAGDRVGARFLLQYRVRARRLHSQATKDLAELQRLLPRLGD